MATGRSLNKDARVYINGFDLSGHARSIGELAWSFAEGIDDPLNVTIKGTWLGHANISPGVVNAIFDNTATTGIHAVLSGAPAKRTVLVAQGIQAAPIDNDPCFGGQFLQTDYKVGPSADPVTVTVTFGQAHGTMSNPLYAEPWGVLLHALATRTAVNAATGLDQTAATSKGGFMVYHVTAGNGTAAIKVQDAATNTDLSFADLLSTGLIDCSVRQHGIVALATTATVRQYVRWQITLGTATSLTFTLGWFRNYI